MGDYQQFFMNYIFMINGLFQECLLKYRNGVKHHLHFDCVLSLLKNPSSPEFFSILIDIMLLIISFRFFKTKFQLQYDTGGIFPLNI